MDFLAWLSAMGGVCTTSRALELLTPRELRALRRRGALWVPLRGWTALDGVRNDVTRALDLGGVVSCVSAFRAHGLWTPHGDRDLHIRVHRETHSAKLAKAEDADGVHVHRLLGRLPEQRPWDGVDSVLTSLAVATSCVSAADAVAAADVALRLGKLQLEDLSELRQQLPESRSRVLATANGLAGSGTESLFAAVLRRAGIRFQQQPQLLPGEFFDFLIGTSLVVEIDSLAWHGSREQMANDRRRDAELTLLGYRVIRFTYEQVLLDPERVLSTVLTLVRRDVHERALFPRDA
ncbi:DUF559 domain-containing protein [Agrococcus sp. 1P02AA]|uniref:endonuclease domain-containing protein n=1 Tax=Agrococcus sp. 1P02AA TaxID=3132259 RepID=UPI0039A6B342